MASTLRRGRHRLSFESGHDTVMVKARRDCLNGAITAVARTEVHPGRAPARLRPRVSTLTAFGLAVEIGDWHRFTGNTIGSFVGRVPNEYCSGSSPVQRSVTETATATPGCGSSRLPGNTAPGTLRARRC